MGPGPDTVAVLRDYVELWEQERHLLAQDTRLVFVWPDGRALHPDTITALFHKHCEGAGLPRIRLHDVRHSYVTAALLAGVPAKVISERLGHADAEAKRTGLGQSPRPAVVAGAGFEPATSGL